MKESIFSKNELKYLKNKNSMGKEYDKNYIHQVRFSIKKKLSNFINNDVDLLLEFEDLFESKLIESFISKIKKKHFILIKELLDG